ncbi:MAG: SMI1/KNR4 family protein [Planctomycetaceae bacterium]
MNTEIAPHRPLADKYSFAGGSHWSGAIAERYHLQLSAELVDWFDSGVCEALGHGEFCEPASPDQLLVTAPECIWPGLMPPDFLPLVGNGLGDWLCGRVTAQGTIDEILYWYHGGGDYLPYGAGLAEALLFDTLADRLPGRRQLHAIPAERESLEPHERVSGTMIAWALRQLPSDVAEVLAIDAPPSRVASALMQHGVALDAVRCDTVLAALDNVLRIRMTASDAQSLGVQWDRDVAKWMFDTDTIPADVRAMLRARWDLADDHGFGQDWQTVERVCSQLAQERDDLGWVHDCLGWSAQRRGDLATAIDHYERAATTSVFTDQAVRFRTHFDSEKIAKFSVARLLEIGGGQRLDARYLEALCRAEEPNWRERVTAYWLDQAADPAMTAADRYAHIHRAGWDVGCDSMRRYRELLEQLADAAIAAGQFARAELARTHAACIDDRYGRHLA